jgi:hypothetical protein
MRFAELRIMSTAQQFKDDEEQQISRGGKGTALWTIGLAVFFVAGGIAVAASLRHHVSPPARPGTTEGETRSGEVKPPSP